jgi:hypothetical protein
MSEEKSSPIGIIVVVAAIAVVAGIFLFKGGGNGDQNAGNQQQPTNGSDTNKTAKPPSPKKKENGSDTNKTAELPEPAKPEKPAEPEEPAFIKESLVAYYPFNGNANDESGNENDGEVKGATLAADRHGEDGKAYRFDGKDDYIEVADSSSLDLGNGAGKEWTVTIWFKGDITRSGWLLRKGGSGGSHTTDYGVLASSSHRTFVWGTGRSAATGGNDTNDWMVTPSNNIGTAEWHHVVATYKQGASNAGFKIFYIDGQQTGGATSGNRKNPANDGSMRIGAGRQKARWLGLIDDIRIYNRALSEEQVKTLYDLEKPKE